MREFTEETGLTATIDQQLGATSFIYPWKYQHWTINQHICVFYALSINGGKLETSVAQFMGQDSLGACALPLDTLTWANASPLVMFAKAFLTTGQPELTTKTFSNWEVLKEAANPS
ncbi:NUDIX family hydrolase [Lacticaseibacillus paracasei subsp. paracasei Lpp17]|nr:NUDIX family hydrolase [Lacticaseibacillus paracasei subsp. paracasei Lpp17]